jgi:hypothetical protein
MNQAAAVIDLDSFRRQRHGERGAERPQPRPRPVANAMWMPVLVTWIPVWPVA